MVMLNDGILTQRSINLFFKIVDEFRRYILAVYKPTRIFFISEGYMIDYFGTDVDFYAVKGIKQQPAEFRVKLIEVIDTFECSSLSQLVVTMLKIRKLNLIRKRIKTKPIIPDISRISFAFSSLSNIIPLDLSLAICSSIVYAFFIYFLLLCEGSVFYYDWGI